jgi:hypothetical protein
MSLLDFILTPGQAHDLKGTNAPLRISSTASRRYRNREQ